MSNTLISRASRQSVAGMLVGSRRAPRRRVRRLRDARHARRGRHRDAARQDHEHAERCALRRRAAARAGRGSIGARVELDDIDGDLLLAVRALDYRRQSSERFAVTAFFGAARLDLATPAYGYYFGGGVQLKELWPSWNLAVDVRFGDKIARDNVLPTDPQGGKGPTTSTISRASAVYFSRRF